MTVIGHHKNKVNRELLAICSIFLLLVATLSVSAESVFTHAGKVVAVGDLHGDYDQYVKILKANKLVDKKLKWAGGDIHFVQLGDVTDRGPDSLKIIRHLMKLEKQAKSAGGRVHVLIGNHEAMNVQTDLRYVHPGEYQALVTRKSPRFQDRYIDAVFKAMVANQPELIDAEASTRANLKKRFPLGYVEHRQLWEPGQELAKWYANHNAVIQINDTIYVHGGLDPHVEQYPSFEELNRSVTDELKPGGLRLFTVGERGPLWYRGLARNAEELELAPLEKMLDHYDAKRIVIAHTTTRGAVMPRFDRRVILADVGIAAHYGRGMANLVVESDKLYSLHRGEMIELPLDADKQAYLNRVSTLEPPGSRLVQFLKSQSASPITP